MLAGSLADRDAAAGFAAYEHHTRGFVTVNQDQIGEGGATLFPTTARALEQRNDMLRKLKEHRTRDAAEVMSTQTSTAGGGLFSRLRETFTGR